ncbi:hypothetical protein DICPUDRAFT_38290 [Dictyostelium purpureum]|uniref:SMP-LTD domain-containing protein n=1 Tax=Dictyostelium purpureum TaxID=5786 RepID=F0ZU49_DICPU|nr:uncharacterized protein DICPUDRAFT_38290 [Dictyostelium purpureum]EGC32536.1 hypothetical protein DICPUDRAFT_38290 [Dictyostelium purpureum]|eukprot:XP_003290948.1 hypothetical protein DICPUDRAFT_38290 [Dictyostelium purpureum]
MSLKIYWDRITEKHSIKLMNHLNQQLSGLTKTYENIGELKLSNLSLGSKPPTFEIIQISDPDALILGTKSPNGIELRAKIGYEGDAFIIVQTEFKVNLPTPNFITFPVTVKVSNPKFSGIASVIYDTDKVCFCFVPPADNSEGDYTPLKDFKFETQLGDSDQHVLADLDKLENFIVGEIKSLLKKYLVYPNKLTVLLSDFN